MPDLHVLRISSPEQLRRHAPAWDCLWEQSEVANPTVRAEIIALWIEAFAPRARCCVLAVEQEGRFLAGLPLVGHWWRRVVPVGRLTGNAWCQAADLLLDDRSGTPREEILDALAAALDRLPWPLAMLDDVPVAAPRWRDLAAAVERRGIGVCVQTEYHVGRVRVPADWNALESSWSKNHRRKLRRTLAKIERDGGCRLVRHETIDPIDAAALLRPAFEMENNGWKGAAGTSVLGSPFVLAFYDRVARQLAAWNQLDVQYLELAGRNIAFNYGCRAKGIAFGAKVGYDEQFARYSPGHILVYHLLRDYHAAGEPAVHDFVGPLADWTSDWANERYPVGRMVIGSSRWLGKAAFRGYLACVARRMTNGSVMERAAAVSPAASLPRAEQDVCV
jgi:CelD/BcsL family acetyltransferase involved in cellulose biosynthesis